MNYPNITYKRTCTICNKGKEYPEISYSPSFLWEAVPIDMGQRWNMMFPIEREQLGIKAGLDAERRSKFWIELFPEEKRAIIRQFKKEPPITPEVTEAVWNTLPAYRQAEIAKSVGLIPRLGTVYWKELTPSERDSLSKAKVVIPKAEVTPEVTNIDLLAITEGNPLRKFCCRQCGECAPKELLEEGKFPERIAWLRHHYKEKHPSTWGKQYPEVKYKPSYLKQPDQPKLSKAEIDALRYAARERDFIATAGLDTQVEALQLKSGQWRAYLIDFITPWSPRGQAAESKEVVRDGYGNIITGFTRENLIEQLKAEYPGWRWKTLGSKSSSSKEADYDIPLATKLSAELKKEFEKPSYLKETKQED